MREPTILDRIVARRRERVAREGAALGVRLPARRTSPIVPFGGNPFLICEIKRASPSRGAIARCADAVEQAACYAERGTRTVSVLTEEEHFCGSLADLVRVKRAFPGLCVLRKDFLIDESDIEASHRAGADAVLLIARVHDSATLGRLYEKTKSLGMEALLEVHDDEDLEKAGSLAPAFTGFNSRDLASLKIDPVVPLRLLGRVGWKTTAVYESGIGSGEEGLFALSSGFQGLLVGEAVMRDRGLIGELIGAFNDARGPGGGYEGAESGTGAGRKDFWLRLYAPRGETGRVNATGRAGTPAAEWPRRARPRTLVKICGITNREDALLARRLGADILGFVFAPSPRRADPGLLRDLRDLDTLKVGVVAGGPAEPILDPAVKDLLDLGLIDAVQFHGSEDPEQCYRAAFPYYKAVRVGEERDVEAAGAFRCPRVLADASVPGLHGGTGRSIPDSLVRRLGERGPLWLAGGIGPENVRGLIRAFGPELVDCSSMLEASPGKKDPQKLKRFFEEVARAEEQP
jgi:indole-3-glycerol phosphate synthase / phosphoribosylanthranilate isomerase